MLSLIEKTERQEKKFGEILPYERAEITRQKRRLDAFMRGSWWLSLLAVLAFSPVEWFGSKVLAFSVFGWLFFSPLYKWLPIIKRARELCLAGHGRFLDFQTVDFGKVRYIPSYWSGFWKTLIGVSDIHEYAECQWLQIGWGMTVRPYKFSDYISSNGERRVVECMASTAKVILFPDQRPFHDVKITFFEEAALSDDTIECRIVIPGMIHTFANHFNKGSKIPCSAFGIEIRAPQKLFLKIVDCEKDRKPFRFTFTFPELQMFSLWENRSSFRMPRVMFLEEEDRDKFDFLRKQMEFEKSDYSYELI